MSQIQDSPEAHPEAQAAFRLRIWHLFYLTALIAVGLFVAGGISIVISSVVLVAWWMRHRMMSARTFFLAFVIVVVLLGMLLPAIQTNRISWLWMTCGSNIRQCVLAIQNYESANLCFPPVWEEGESGKPMHSWRVLILPYLGFNALYNQYDFAEPWDGPNNSKLADQMPDVYRCRSATDSASETPYKLVSDKAAILHGCEKRSLKDALDGTVSIIVLVEDSENPVNWMKPEGLSIEDAVSICLRETACHCGCHETIYSKGVPFRNVATLDGAFCRVSSKADPDLLRAAMRCADGVSVDWSKLDSRSSVYKPGGFVALAIYIVLLALPGWFLKKRNAA